MDTILKKTKLANVVCFFPEVCIVLGLFILGGLGIVKFYPLALTFLHPTQIYLPAGSIQPKLLPVSISIPGVIPARAVIPGQIMNGQWQLSPNQVIYLSESGELGKSGNAVFYGHDTNQVWSALHLVKDDDKIILTTNHGIKLSYQVSDIKYVLATDVDILKPSNQEIITLFTCAGILDSQRMVVTARRIQT